MGFIAIALARLGPLAKLVKVLAGFLCALVDKHISENALVEFN
jgi:hypothetical protein